METNVKILTNGNNPYILGFNGYILKNIETAEDLKNQEGIFGLFSLFSDTMYPDVLVFYDMTNIPNFQKEFHGPLPTNRRYQSQNTHHFQDYLHKCSNSTRVGVVGGDWGRYKTNDSNLEYKITHGNDLFPNIPFSMIYELMTRFNFTLNN